MNNENAQPNSVVYTQLIASCEVDNLALTTWREECIIMRVTEGEGRIYIDGESFAAQKADYFVLRSFVTYSLHKNSEKPFAVEQFVFNARLLANSCGDEYNLGDYLYFIKEKNVPCAVKQSMAWYAAFDEYAKGLFEKNDNSNKTELLYKAVSVLYGNRFISTDLNLKEEKQRFAIKTIITYIRSNYCKTISVKEAAEAVGYDEFYTMKLFKKFTGLPLIEYANRYRIMLARELLTATNEPICQIANKTGFTNISYFNRQFKRLTIVTPAIYRLTEQSRKTF